MSKNHVLFVDDEINVLSSLRRGLMDEDYTCYFANSAKEGLEILEKQEISVVVSDMKMPVMDGLTFLKMVKEKYPNTVRVVLSGYTQLQQVLLAVNQGDIYKFIKKPWKLEDEFKPIIRQAVDYYNMIIAKEEFNKILEAKNASIQNILKEMNGKLSIGRKDYDDIKKFFAGILDFAMNSIRGMNTLNYGLESQLETVRSFGQGFLGTVPSIYKEFNLSKLLEEAAASVSKAAGLKAVVIDSKDKKEITCYGNYGRSLFIIPYILKYVISGKSVGKLQIALNSTIYSNFVNAEIIIELEVDDCTGDKNSQEGQKSSEFLEQLINEAMKELDTRVTIQNLNNFILIKYQTVFTLR